LSRGGAALLAGALALAAAAPAAAHSLLLESSPAPNATLTASPPRLVLRFNNRIEKALSRVRLVDERGGVVAVAVAVADGSTDRLTASVPALGPGRWRVEWQVLSTDGHVVTGSFAFRLAP
jgi:hypothetical protein